MATVMRFARPNTIDEISQFERRHGIVLPNSYVEFMITTGGGSPAPDCAFDADGTLKAHIARVFPLHEEPMVDQSFAFPPPRETGFLPIGTNAGGDYLLMHLQSGSIYYWDHEVDHLEPVAADLRLVAGNLGELVDSLVFPPGEGRVEIAEVERIGKEGTVDDLEILVGKGGLHAPNPAGRTVAEVAARHGNLPVLERCLDLGIPATGLLFFAAPSRSTAVIRLLLARGAEINEVDHLGGTPLDRALDPQVYELLESSGARHLRLSKPPHLR